MGCDIHCALEVRIAGKWQAQKFPNPYFGKYGDKEKENFKFNAGGRNYDTFAILGNVRNGTGFAGCVTGDGFNFIQDSRGLPNDVDKNTLTALSDEHSAGYVTARELIEFDWTQVSTHHGIVDACVFEEWDRRKQWEPAPREYCGGVSGQSVKIISEDEMRQIVSSVVGDSRGKERDDAIKKLKQDYYNHYCSVSWVEGYAKSTGDFFTKSFPVVLKYAAIHGHDNVRLVFDFDS